MGGDRGRRAWIHISDLLAGEAEGLSRGNAFLARFLKAERRIFAYALTLLPHQADAQDVLQEASLVMWEKFDERDPPEDFVAWGCRIAFFKIQDYRRGRRRQRVQFSDAMLERLAETQEARATALQLDERYEALTRCIEKLDRGDREMLAERYKEGATVQMVAGVVGRSVDAVYKALARIRKALHDCITRTLAAEDRS